MSLKKYSIRWNCIEKCTFLLETATIKMSKIKMLLVREYYRRIWKLLNEKYVYDCFDLYRR